MEKMNLKKYRKIVTEYSSSFSKLEVHTKKQKIRTELNKKIIIGKREYILTQTREFSFWEEKLIQRIENAGLKTERKFFKFPLKIDDKLYLYIPDLLIKDLQINRKKVVIEAHEKLTEDDIKKYRKFRSQYGREYHLIMIVSSNELSEWNSHNKKEGLFHEIWTSKDIELMLVKLKAVKKDREKIDSSFGTHVCPSCGTSATGREETRTEFGFRKKEDGTEYTQSLCYDCRRNHAKTRRRKKAPKKV